jgi:hypothetical protein
MQRAPPQRREPLIRLHDTVAEVAKAFGNGLANGHLVVRRAHAGRARTSELLQHAPMAAAERVGSA